MTTIIAMINKPLLTGWAARLAAEYAVGQWDAMSTWNPRVKIREIKNAHERERDASAVLGTAVHAALDAWVKGELHQHSREVDPYMNSFIKFLTEKRPRFLRSEVTVWSRKYDYAGTADIICEIDNKIYLADYKTGKNLHSEVGLQLAALSNADFIINPDGTEEELPAIESLAAIHIRPRSWKFVPVKHVDENFKAFLAARQLHFWSTEIAPEVLAA